MLRWGAVSHRSIALAPFANIQLSQYNLSALNEAKNTNVLCWLHGFSPSYNLTENRNLKLGYH